MQDKPTQYRPMPHSPISRRFINPSVLEVMTTLKKIKKKFKLN